MQNREAAVREANRYPLHLTDGGRSQSRRPRQANDCTVISLAIATGMKYDDVYDMLMVAGRKSHQGFNVRKYFKTATVNGFKFEYEVYQPVKYQPRMNVSSFCASHNVGIWIARVSKHVFAVVNGVAFDQSRTYNERCVYCAWRLVKTTDS